MCATVSAALLAGAYLGDAQAQTATVTALTGQSCAGTRFGSNLGCTANDFSSSLTFDQPAATALSSCRAGETVTIDVIAQTTSSSPTRYDGAYFIGEMGTSPEIDDATKSCSLGVFPTTPYPFEAWDTDSCGDYAAGQSSTLLIEDVAIKCTPAPGTNLLAIPYVLVFSNQTGGNSCTAANVTANTKSKCVSSTTATVTGVSVNGYIQITKQTLPNGHSQTFGFTGTESGGATVTPSTFNLSDGQTQIVEVPFTSTGGSRVLTLTESAVTGWAPTASISCTTPSGGSAASYVTVNNANRTITATLSTANFGAVCTITNTKIPTVKLQKRTNGGFSGPFSFTQTNLASTPAGITTTAIGSATPASPTAIAVSAIGTAVSLTETAATNYRLTDAACTDSQSGLTGNVGSIGSLSGTTLTIPSGNVNAGAEYTCLFTNARIPTVTLRKVTLGNAGGPFSFTAGNLDATPADITTSTAGVAAPASPTAITVANIGQDVTITESAAAGYKITGASCTDANSTVTGNTGSFGSLSGSTLTIPAARVVAGAQFNCTFTNRKVPTVRLQKITLGGASGPFTFAVSNLDSTPAGITTGAATVAAPATPSAIEVTTLGADVAVTETVAPGYFITGATCIDANGAATGNSGAIGTLTGTTLTIPGAAIVHGADFLCTFTNTLAEPELTVAKSASVASVDAAGDAITYTIEVSNTGNVTVSAITVSDPLGSVTCTTSGNATITSLAPGGAETCSLTYTVTQAQLDSNGGGDNDIDNTATASGTYDSTAVVGQGAASVTLVALPALQVTKTADDTTAVTAGQTVTYTYVVSNTGNQTISGISLGDAHNGSGASPVPGNETLSTDSGTIGDSTDVTADDGIWSALAPGDAVTFTATYTITQTDVDTRQ
jgi:uncharacterized repeat protein (TIGR01451 family)